MSLIYFHLVLIGTAIAFAFGLGVWGIEHFAKSQSLVELGTGVGSFIVAFLLAVYLGWFIQKNKKQWKAPE